MTAIVTAAALAGGWMRADIPGPSDAVHLVGDLQNSRLQFERSHHGRVAFLGGSITEMEGYRPRVSALLRARFPETEFAFINAGIASTCSNTGAFRLAQDVLADGLVDLLVVEFAVNDDQDGGFTRTECIRGLEGIVRHALTVNPRTDIVVAYFVNAASLKSYQAGQTPLTIAAHQTVATSYHLSTVNIAQALAAAIGGGTMTWQRYGGVHPGPAGADFCAQQFGRLFAAAWDPPLAADAEPVVHPLPVAPLDPFSYSRGRLVSPQQASVKSGWTWGIPDWDSLAGGKRPRFTSIPLLSATEPGAELSFRFSGTAVGAFVVSGPDAGVIEARIDDGAVRRISLKTPHSNTLHYPWTVMFGTELAPGNHVLNLRMADETAGSGHAMRIIQFAVNEP